MIMVKIVVKWFGQYLGQTPDNNHRGPAIPGNNINCNTRRQIGLMSGQGIRSDQRGCCGISFGPFRWPTVAATPDKSRYYKSAQHPTSDQRGPPVAATQESIQHPTRADTQKPKDNATRADTASDTSRYSTRQESLPALRHGPRPWLAPKDGGESGPAAVQQKSIDNPTTPVSPWDSLSLPLAPRGGPARAGVPARLARPALLALAASASLRLHAGNEG